MGIFGAMTTAITGLQSQSSALENISNNIANSQTVGYKRTETSFSELVAESPPKQQALGVVQAFTRATNGVQGDIVNSDEDTFIAINGDGFFAVGEQAGTVDGEPIFSDESVYTRRGDFELDRNGYLVNGSGYFLRGLPVDSITGNTTSSLPEIIQINNDVLPAVATTEIDYRANLARNPSTTDTQDGIALSDRLNVSEYASDPTVAGVGTISGTDSSTFIDQSKSGGALALYDASGTSVDIQFRWAKLFPDTVTGTADLSGDLDATGLADGDSITIKMNGETFTIGFNTTGTPGAGQDAAIDLFGIDDADGGGDDATGADLVSVINSLFTSTSGGSIATLNGSNQLELQPEDNTEIEITGSSATVLTALGLDAVGTGSSTARTIENNETWNMFYLSDSTANGTATAWTNLGVDYVFGDDFKLEPDITQTTISNVTIDGVNLGNILLDHGAEGITQFGDATGLTTPNVLAQDGSAAGKLTGISVSDEGRVVASYSNGRSIDKAEVILVGFSSPSNLAKINGGAYRATVESGDPVIGAQGNLISSALEASNTDIADEFTKLIVTQQAYAANTRVISTGDEMIQEALNIVR